MNPRDKILPLEKLSARLEEARAEGHRVALCHGVFDLLHPGHITHLQQAHQYADVLVVTVTADVHVNKGPGRPAFPEQARMESLAALHCVQYVALSEEPTAIDVIRALKPDYYVKGSEYASAENDLTGKIEDEVQAVREIGGEVIFTDGEVFSSSSLINRYFSTLPPQAAAYLDQFRKHHDGDAIVQRLNALSDLNVLVIGDIIIDQYHYCMPLAKSPREMIVASKYLSEEQFAGGSLAVANHVSGFCKHVTLATTMGTEEDLMAFVREHLRPNVTLLAQQTPSRPTTVKRRYLDYTFLSKMFEVQFLDDAPYPENIETALCDQVSAALTQHDLVIVCDFGHGLLTERVRRILSNSASFIAVNTQTNSANLGFNTLFRYERADYACLHELELRLSAGSKYDPPAMLAQDALNRLKSRALMVTSGPRGTILTDASGELHETPALSSRIVDRVGAGDTVFAITSLLAYTDCPGDVLGFVGNCAGAMAVQTVCNREPLDPAVIKKFIVHLLK